MVALYVIIFVVGLIAGAVYSYLPIKKQRSQPQKFPDHLDDIDEMLLWGEVNNDPFYKGY